MKNFILFLVILLTLASCGASKNYLERSDADRALIDAAKKLDKNPSDEKALAAVPILYKSVVASHLAKIKSYRSGSDVARWDKIIAEYQDLQTAYNAVLQSSGAFKLVNPQNFSTELLEAKQNAAEEKYAAGNVYLAKSDRESAKKAYSLFSRAEKYIPGYKDAQQLKEQAYENSIVNVVITPVQDDSYFFNSGFGNYGYNYSNEYFQQNLIRDLQNTNNSNRYAARFLTDWEARRNNVTPDWVVDLRLRNMSIPFPFTNSYNRRVSNRIQTGTDTSGKGIYQTVYATITVNRTSFTATANMEVAIRDLKTNRNISMRTFRDDFRWLQESGTFTGDSRALNNSDWAIINNVNYRNAPRQEEILYELYRDIYPQVRNNILYSVDW